MPKTEEKVLSIINNYGAEHQKEKLEEEYNELQDEIDKFIDGKEHNILTEVADVIHLCLQFALKSGYTLEDVDDELNFKIDRQIGRMSRGE